MRDVETILDECLERIEAGDATTGECLAQYPELADTLRGPLLIAERLRAQQSPRPTTRFKTKARTRLYAHMRANPRRPTFSLGIRRRLRPMLGLAAALILFLAVGTALAQTAMPGDPLYPWKRAGEHVWRATQSDPLAADLSLADRRAAELVEVAGTPTAYQQALEAYEETLNRVADNANTEPARVGQTLQNHRRIFENAGIDVPALDSVLSEVVPNAAPETDGPIDATITPSVPATAPAVATEAPQPLPTDTGAPELSAPTSMPATVVPTEAPTQIVPTEPPVEIVPTEVPATISIEGVPTVTQELPATPTVVPDLLD